MELGIAATSLGGGFFGGIVIGYALEKVAKVSGISRTSISAIPRNSEHELE